jgi:ribosome-binding factor A
MPNHRAIRVGEEIKREISLMIREDLKDPRIQENVLLSITDVEVTNDFRYAKVFFSQISKTVDSKETLKALEKAAGYLRSELAKRLQLRYTPELIFKYDESLAYGSKISKMIFDIKNQEDGNTNV